VQRETDGTKTDLAEQLARLMAQQLTTEGDPTDAHL
jgi:hypothetical protein